MFNRNINNVYEIIVKGKGNVWFGFKPLFYSSGRLQYKKRIGIVYVHGNAENEFPNKTFDLIVSNFIP